MKDLILVGAHCPDNERKKILFDCVNSLQNLRNKFDILVCSHTYIPEYIVDRIDYFFLDNENNLIELEKNISDDDMKRLKDLYFIENTTCDNINYDNFNFSLNNGDYLMPTL